MLNGYMQDAPKTFVETALKCLIVGAIFVMLKKKADGDKKKEYGAAMICAVVYGCINVIMEFIMGTISMMIMGSGFAAAVMGAFTSLPATVINAVFMVIAIAVLYQPVKNLCAHGIERDSGKNNELNKKSGYAVSGVSALLISESVIFIRNIC